MRSGVKSVLVDGKNRRLDIPTGVRGILWRLGLKLTRLSRFPRGASIYLDLARYPPAGGVNVVLDVGANVGQTAIEYSYYFPSATIHSFEHASATFLELERNTRGLENVYCHRFALGPEDGEVTLNLQSESINNSLNPVVQRGNAVHTRPTGESEVVRMRSIESFCDEMSIDRIDVLKIDAGGYDLEILEGARALLRAGRVQLVFAEMTFDPRNNIHCQFDKCVEFFSSVSMVPVAIYDQSVAADSSRNYYANALFACAPDLHVGSD